VKTSVSILDAPAGTQTKHFSIRKQREDAVNKIVSEIISVSIVRGSVGINTTCGRVTYMNPPMMEI
jgi:hypothetical protein